MALGILVGGFYPEKAQAADRNWGNVDVAKKAIKNMAPVISDIKQDETSGSLVVAANEFIQKPLVAETEITPEPKPVARRTVAQKVNYVKPVIKEIPAEEVASNSVHNFPYGYCTYYVAQRRPIYWSGNAITWLSHAQIAGFPTGYTPSVGAIMVTSEGGYTGHVAYVEAINGEDITISEMNYNGWGVTSSRTISSSYGAIRGYIY